MGKGRKGTGLLAPSATASRACHAIGRRLVVRNPSSELPDRSAAGPNRAYPRRHCRNSPSQLCAGRRANAVANRLGTRHVQARLWLSLLPRATSPPFLTRRCGAMPHSRLIRTSMHMHMHMDMDMHMHTQRRMSVRMAGARLPLHCNGEGSGGMHASRAAVACMQAGQRWHACMQGSGGMHASRARWHAS
eukprot:366467-Chlamydomonas_euryale.AAC.8